MIRNLRLIYGTSTIFMTGNEFHTIDVSRPYDDPKEVSKPRPENSMMKISYINHGHYRDVFIVGECSEE